jgi:4-hydroxythreonine-4-phosphate dehydrogenase
VTLVVTPGMGIGPEVTARALISGDVTAPVVLIGERGPISSAADAAGLRLTELDSADAIAALSDGDVGLIVPDSAEEPVPVAAIRLGAELCLSGTASALVTGPIHKARLAAQGFAHRGHTELLGAVCDVPHPVMAFAGGKLRVALVTTHLPLSDVPAAITQDRVLHVVRVVDHALRTDLGIAAPRIAVCGLNPHAGENGLLGDTEIRTIGPACETLRVEGHDVRGPISAETAFMDMHAGALDIVVAMYHDQGLVPLKVVDFGRSVNWTLGLPIVRTSVDHGTADALVGTGRAGPASMVAAMAFAAAVVARRQGC